MSAEQEFTKNLGNRGPEVRLDAARSITFDDCREKFIASHRAAWVNDKHLKQWETTLKTYVTSVFGALPVQNVDVALVLKALQTDLDDQARDRESSSGTH